MSQQTHGRSTGHLRKTSAQILGWLMAVLLAGCSSGSSEKKSSEEVVVYTALDREFSEPILKRFQEATEVQYRAKYDVESSKTVGLVNTLMQEAKRPRCDVFWNNEILHTLRLRREGLLDAYLSPAAADFPAAYLAQDKTWHGFATRARVFIVNTNVLKPDEYPQSIRELADPKWKGKVGIARPLFGTTATHAAVLFDLWGSEKAEEFFEQVAQNAKVVSGNKQVAEEVAAGQLAFGITDTDDAIIEVEKGEPVAILFPDQEPDGLGTLLVPNSLCILKNAPNLENAKKLVDFLLQPSTETLLAKGPSAQFPVNPKVETKSRIQLPEKVVWTKADYEKASLRWDEAKEFLRKRF